MKRLIPMLFVVIGCGGPQAKQPSPIVKGAEVPGGGCCCKTVPLTDEKEVTPAFAMKGRMECSADNGDCVDAVQCNGAGSDQTAGTTDTGTTGTGTTDTGVPPPPDLGSGGSSDTGVPPPPNLGSGGS